MIEALLVLLLLVFWLLIAPHRSFKDKYKSFIDDIVHTSGYVCPSFNLVERYTFGNSYTQFHNNKTPTIYILARDGQGRAYDEDTIKLAIIHEMSHVIYGGENHPKEFYDIERKLKDVAIHTNHLHGESQVDPMYPCVNSL